MFIENKLVVTHINDKMHGRDRWADVTDDGWENLTSIDSTFKKY